MGGLARHWIKTDNEENKRASFPELFFDLVFVFALIQLSQTLAKEFNSASMLEAVVLIMAIWWVWIYTTWVTNLLDTENEAVRLLLFALMFCGVLLGIELPHAFGDQGLIFAGLYSAMQIGRSLFMLYAYRNVEREAFLTFLRITVWLSLSCLFWLLGGLGPSEWRVVYWLIALAIEYFSPMVRYWVPGLGRSAKESLNISGAHMAERCGLFVILCLGETILTTGKNAAEHMDENLTFIILCSAFLNTVAMWWIYFHHGHEKAADKAETTCKPESLAHNLFAYGHLPIVAGIILTAVGENFSLSQAEEDNTFWQVSAILGGPALFLSGNAWIKIVAARSMPVSHLLGIALLIVTAFAAPMTPVYYIQILATMILTVVAVWEYVALKRTAMTTA